MVKRKAKGFATAPPSGPPPAVTKSNTPKDHPPDHPARPKKRSQTKPKKKPGRKSVGFQFDIADVQAINDYAKKNGLFKQIAFDRIIEKGLGLIKPGEDLTKPERQGPGDHAYDSQYTARISPDVLAKLDKAVKTGNTTRSHLARLLIRRVTQAE